MVDPYGATAYTVDPYGGTGSLSMDPTYNPSLSTYEADMMSYGYFPDPRLSTPQVDALGNVAGLAGGAGSMQAAGAAGSIVMQPHYEYSYAYGTGQ